MKNKEIIVYVVKEWVFNESYHDCNCIEYNINSIWFDKEKAK